MKTKKAISLWSAISIGIGGMVGAGIFSILGAATQIAGNAVYVSFICAGLVALFSTYSYAKLGSKFPSAGGPVEFLIKGLGDNIWSGGFNILLWFGYIFALSLYAKAFGGYALTFFPANSSHIWINVLATLIIILFTLINFIGARAVGNSETLIVAIKVGILLVFAIIGFFFIQPNLLSTAKWPTSSHILFGSALVFIAYEGFGLITNAAEDMENPQKILPRALYLSVFFVIIIYVLVSLTVVGNLPIPRIIKAQDYALAEAAKPFLGSVGFRIIAIAALFSTASAINATLYGGANVSYMIAREGELPQMFERKVWERSSEGLFITSVLVIILVNFLNLSRIAMIGSASFLIIYAAVNIAHIRLYKITGANLILIWLAIIGCLTSLGILIKYEVQTSLLTLFVLLAVLAGSFILEAIYRKVASRRLFTRT